jgi:hypothetical protein
MPKLQLGLNTSISLLLKGGGDILIKVQCEKISEVADESYVIVVV